MQLAPGCFVRLKTNPIRAGILQDAQKIVAGARMVRVLFADGQTSWLPYSALEPVPQVDESCLDRFKAGKFVSPEWLRRTLMRLRVSGRLSDVVYSMEATETDFYPHQFKPVIKLMESPTDSLLIADEVGLGKTIEAGLIWTELRARQDCNRLLVACPKTLCEKWRHELNSRFGVDVQIADAQSTLSTLRRARETGSGFGLVCSMQSLRPPKGWDKNDSAASTTHGARGELARFLFDEGDGEPLIDLLVIDEAHHMRNPRTMLNAFGTLASSIASHRLFLSATPIHLRNEDLHSILKMVDPETFEYPSTLNDLISANEPLVAARDLLLSQGTTEEVNRLLEQAYHHDLLGESKALNHIRMRLRSQELDRSTRSELAIRLERVNQLANYVNRTRRRDIQERRVVREPKTPTLSMNQHEQKFYEEISKVVNDYAELQNVNRLFLLSMPQRLLTSSLAAASSYWSSIHSMASAEEIEEIDVELDEDTVDQRPLVTKIAKRTNELSMTALLEQNDTKFGLLLTELRRVWVEDREAKIIVFSSFKPTLEYLSSRLVAEGIESELLHGSVNEPRSRILSRFQTVATTRLLLSSEVGSEGIDLQFCSIIVNYDIPWNPMRLEQRIGRIDRLGQEKAKVQILNLIFDETIDSRIYHRLYERLTIGQRALGEMEAILGQQIRTMTMKLLDPRLSHQQKEEVIDQTAQALETQRKEADRLESEAGALVHHGDYILERIYETKNRRRWLNGEDILHYVRDCLEKKFPGTTIQSSPQGSETYRISLSDRGFAELSTFLSRNGLRGRTRILDADSRQRFAFTESVVQKPGRVENISQLHPLVRFCVEGDRSDKTGQIAQAVAAIVEESEVAPRIREGVFVIAIHCWSSANSLTGSSPNARIGYVGANVETGELISADDSEQIAAAAAYSNLSVFNASIHPSFVKAAEVLVDAVIPEIDSKFEEYVEQVSTESEDRMNIRRRALVSHFNKKLERLQGARSQLVRQVLLAETTSDDTRVRNLRNLVLAQEANISRLKKTLSSREYEIEQQKQTTPEATEVCLLLAEVSASPT